VLLIADHHSIELQEAIERKWLARVPRTAVEDEDVPTNHTS
jgi:hypothetical protein